MLGTAACSRLRDAAKAVDYDTIDPPVRDDGGRRLPPDGGVLRPGDRGRIAARFSGPKYALLAVTIGLSGHALGVPGQRRRLRRAHAVGPPPLTSRLKRPADPLPDRPGHRVQRRLGGDDHRQPPEHHHRLVVAYLLPPVRGARLAPIAADRARPSTSLVVALVYRRIARRRPEAGGRTIEPRGMPGRGSIAGCSSRASLVTLATVGLFFAGRYPIALVALAAVAVLLMLGRVRPEKVYDGDRLAVAGDVRRAVRGGPRLRGPRSSTPGGSSAGTPLLGLAGGAGERAVGGAVQFGVQRPGGAPVPAVDGGRCPSRIGSWRGWRCRCRARWPATSRSSARWPTSSWSRTPGRSGTELGFVEYLKVGVPLTILTTLVGVAWLALTHY